MTKRSTNDTQFIMPSHSLKKKIQKGSTTGSPAVSPAGRQTSKKIRYNMKSNTKSKRRTKVQGLVAGLGYKQDQILLQLNKIYSDQKQVKKTGELIHSELFKACAEDSILKIDQLVSQQCELKSLTAGLKQEILIEKRTSNKISSLQEKCILLSKETEGLKQQKSKLEESLEGYKEQLKRAEERLDAVKEVVKSKDKLLLQIQYSSKTKLIDLGSQLTVKTAEADTLRNALKDQNSWLASLQNELGLKKEMYNKLEQSFCKVLEVNNRLQDKLQGESNLLERMLLQSQARKRSSDDLQKLRGQNGQLKKQMERLQADYKLSLRQKELLTDRVQLAQKQQFSQKKRLQLLLDQLNHYKTTLQRQSQELLTQRTLRSAHKNQLQRSCQKLRESLSAKNIEFLQLSLRKEEIEKQISSRREEVQLFNSRVTLQKQAIQANEQHMTRLKQRLDDFLLTVQQDSQSDSRRPEELIRTVINLQNQLFNCQQQSQIKQQQMVQQLIRLQEQVQSLSAQLAVLQQQNRKKTLRIKQLQSLLDQIQEKQEPFEEMSLSINSLIKPPDSTKVELSESLDFDLPIFSKIRVSCFTIVGEAVKTGSVLRAAYLCLAPLLIFQRRDQIVQQIQRICSPLIWQQVQALQLKSYSQLKQSIEDQPKIDLHLTQLVGSLMLAHEGLFEFLRRVSGEWRLNAQISERRARVGEQFWAEEREDQFWIGTKSEYI